MPTPPEFTPRPARIASGAKVFDARLGAGTILSVDEGPQGPVAEIEIPLSGMTVIIPVEKVKETGRLRALITKEQANALMALPARLQAKKRASQSPAEPWRSRKARIDAAVESADPVVCAELIHELALIFRAGNGFTVSDNNSYKETLIPMLAAEIALALGKDYESVEDRIWAAGREIAGGTDPHPYRTRSSEGVAVEVDEDEAGDD